MSSQAASFALKPVVVAGLYLMGVSCARAQTSGRAATPAAASSVTARAAVVKPAEDASPDAAALKEIAVTVSRREQAIRASAGGATVDASACPPSADRQWRRFPLMRDVLLSFIGALCVDDFC
ncbi:hypothetical protein [Burkholderia sp. ABCPW 11]|uniref:hypothetical protein n=1 Tax=Burkholderia sp. ABCPW 11 TaxID=1637859 RepID=UPI00075B6090|nr:hypothetical protein [Burkholderia sp. ABCPW 11]